MVKIRLLAESDIQEIVNNFEKNNWPKPPSTFEPHLKEQRLGERITWIAFYQNEFAGYITLKWCSNTNSRYTSNG